MLAVFLYVRMSPALCMCAFVCVCVCFCVCMYACVCVRARVYQGPWENDLMHGDNGIKVEKDGRTFEVSYRMGKLQNASPTSG